MGKIISLIFLVTLLPNELIGGNSTYMFAVKFAVVALLIVLLRVFKGVRSPEIPIKNLKYFLLVVLVVAVGVIRNNHPTVSFQSNIFRLTYFLIYFYAIFLTYIYYNKNLTPFLQTIFLTILAPSYLYYGLNMLLWAAKFPPIYNVIVHESLGDAIFLSLFGLHVERVQFPLASGFNDYAAQIALTLTISVALFNKYKSINKPILFAGVIISALSILLIDSRIAFTSVIIITLCFVFASKKIKRLIALLSIITLFFSSFLMSNLLSILSTSSAVGNISRTSNDIESGNSRLLIWGYINDELLDFNVQHIIGWGEYGHYGSRVSSKWAQFFVDYVDAKLKTPHNTVYSIIFDYGYIGVICYLLLYIRMFKIMNYDGIENTPIYSVIFAFIVINSLDGVTETIFGFYCQNYIYIFLALVLIIFLASTSLLNQRKVTITTEL